MHDNSNEVSPLSFSFARKKEKFTTKRMVQVTFSAEQHHPALCSCQWNTLDFCNGWTLVTTRAQQEKNLMMMLSFTLSESAWWWYGQTGWTDKKFRCIRLNCFFSKIKNWKSKSWYSLYLRSVIVIHDYFLYYLQFFIF